MRRPYFGWFIVAAAILIYALILGSTFASFGLYVLPVSAEFGLSRADINTGIIILNIGNAALAPIIGCLLDRFSARRLMSICAVLLSGGLVGLSLSHSLWLDILLLGGPVAAGVLGGGTISISVLLARWFKVHRGRAMALAALGMALGGILVAPIVGGLIEGFGWRTALLVIGGAVGALLLLISLFLRDRPGPDDIEVPQRAGEKAEIELAEPHAPSRPQPEEAPPSAGQILRMGLFWRMALGIAIGSGVSQGLTVSLVPLALEGGLSTMEAASLVSATGIAGIGSMLLLAAWGDRGDRTILLSALIVLGAAPCILLLLVESYVALFLTALVLGLALAAVAPVYIALIADRFGLAAFGTVRGLFVPVMSLSGALSVRFIGEIYDRTDGYDVGLWTYLALDFVAAALVLSTWPGWKKRLRVSTSPAVR